MIDPLPDEIEVGTPAFAALNERRGDLVDKKYEGGGLSADEERELAGLEALTDAALNRKYPPPTVPPEMIEAARATAVSVGSEAWNAMNRRRGELIRKEVAGTITPMEAQELARLDQVTDDILDRQYPLPPLPQELLDLLEESKKPLVPAP